MKKLLSLLIVLGTLSAQIIIRASAPEKKVQHESHQDAPAPVKTFEGFKEYITDLFLKLYPNPYYTAEEIKNATDCFISAMYVIFFYTDKDIEDEYLACEKNNFTEPSAYEYAQPSTTFFSHMRNPNAHPIMHHLFSESSKPEHLLFMVGIDKNLHYLVIEKKTVNSIPGWRIYQSCIKIFTTLQWLDKNWKPHYEIDHMQHALAGGGQIIGLPILRMFFTNTKRLFSPSKPDPIMYVRMFDLNNPTPTLPSAPAKAASPATSATAAAAGV